VQLPGDSPPLVVLGAQQVRRELVKLAIGLLEGFLDLLSFRDVQGVGHQRCRVALAVRDGGHLDHHRELAAVLAHVYGFDQVVPQLADVAQSLCHGLAIVGA